MKFTACVRKIGEDKWIAWAANDLFPAGPPAYEEGKTKKEALLNLGNYVKLMVANTEFDVVEVIIPGD